MLKVKRSALAFIFAKVVFSQLFEAKNLRQIKKTVCERSGWKYLHCNKHLWCRFSERPCRFYNCNRLVPWFVTFLVKENSQKDKKTNSRGLQTKSQGPKGPQTSSRYVTCCAVSILHWNAQFPRFMTSGRLGWPRRCIITRPAAAAENHLFFLLFISSLPHCNMIIMIIVMMVIDNAADHDGKIIIMISKASNQTISQLVQNSLREMLHLDKVIITMTLMMGMTMRMMKMTMVMMTPTMTMMPTMMMMTPMMTPTMMKMTPPTTRM